MPFKQETKTRAVEDDSCRFHCCDLDIVDEYCLTCGIFFKNCRSPHHPYSLVDVALCRPRTNEGGMTQCGFVVIWWAFVQMIFMTSLMIYTVFNLAGELDVQSGMSVHPYLLMLFMMLYWTTLVAPFNTYFNLHILWFANAVKHGCCFCSTFCCCGTGQIFIAITSAVGFLYISTEISEVVNFSQGVDGQQYSSVNVDGAMLFNPTLWMGMTTCTIALQLYYAVYTCRFFCDVRNGNVSQGAKQLVGEVVHVVDEVQLALEEETESDTEAGLLA